MSVAVENIASGVYHQEPVHPARYGVAKENAANGYPGILSKSLHGIPNPENEPNPGVKIDPKQKCFFQIRAIVRRLILRLRFIFSVAFWEAQTRVYIFCPVKRKKKFMETAIPDGLPGQALLAAVIFPGTAPWVLLQGQWITEIEISELGLHSSFVFMQQQILRRISLILLGAWQLTNRHRKRFGSASRACCSFSISSGSGHLGAFGYPILHRTWSPSFPLAICRVLVGVMGGTIRR